MLKRNTRTLAIFFGFALLLACAPLATPVSAPPTFDLQSINTAIAWTAESAMTQTAFYVTPSLTPTATLTPTKTPLPTETPTATFIFLLPTIKPSATFTKIPTAKPSSSSGGSSSGSGSTSKYACRVDSQDPADNTKITAGSSFDARWWVTNIGTTKWEKGSVDYSYKEGDAIYKVVAYDLDVPVLPDKQVQLTADMKAPASAGTYTTTWKVSMGKKELCTMSISIIVK